MSVKLSSCVPRNMPIKHAHEPACLPPGSSEDPVGAKAALAPLAQAQTSFLPSFLEPSSTATDTLSAATVAADTGVPSHTNPSFSGACSTTILRAWLRVAGTQSHSLYRMRAAANQAQAGS